MNEDLEVELEALEATYGGALAVEGRGGGGDGGGGGDDGPLQLRLALAPQTGGDAAAAFVAATLVLRPPASYPATPPHCSWTAVQGEGPFPLPGWTSGRKTT